MENRKQRRAKKDKNGNKIIVNNSKNFIKNIMVKGKITK